MQDANARTEPTPSQALIVRSTLEVTARDTDAPAVLKEYLPRGARVHITYLANGDPDETIGQARALATAGFEPIPHVAVRSIASQQALDDYIARIVGEAGASRVLLIAGDLASPRGPFQSAIEVLRTGALERAGLKAAGFATHPEGHPVVPMKVMERALADKLAYAASAGLETELVTQFCFEAAPIAAHVERLRSIGITAPVRIGLAAPTSPALLMKFALRCGVGPSLRALGAQTARLGRLAGAAGPEGVIADLQRDLGRRAISDIAGLHFFVFGGVRKAAAWLQALVAAAEDDRR